MSAGLDASDWEELHFLRDPSGLVGVIAIHDRSAGPARGGTRLRPYPDLETATQDAVRLARAMSRKFAVHGLPCGGGKAALIDDGRWSDPQIREARLEAYAAFLDRLGGAFGTGPDYAFGHAEVASTRAHTQHVVHPDTLDAAVEATAVGVRVALECGLKRSLGKTLADASIAIQGVGAVGGKLARDLAQRGSRLIVADIDLDRASALAAEIGARTVAPDAILLEDVDAIAPCAAGEVLTAEVVGGLRCRVIAGAANNQLPEPEIAGARALATRGVLFVPDFVVSGGAAVVLTGCSPDAPPLPLSQVEARLRSTVEAVLDRAELDGSTPQEAALVIVAERRG